MNQYFYQGIFLHIHTFTSVQNVNTYSASENLKHKFDNSSSLNSFFIAAADAFFGFQLDFRLRLEISSLAHHVSMPRWRKTKQKKSHTAVMSAFVFHTNRMLLYVQSSDNTKMLLSTLISLFLSLSLSLTLPPTQTPRLVRRPDRTGANAAAHQQVHQLQSGAHRGRDN